MKKIETNPTAKIAVKKSVLKAYSVNGLNTVYLKDKTEFEVELFNPTQETVLCKIRINDKELSGGGLVLRPGQRVFLERYLSDNRKFKFETYEIDPNDSAAMYAANKNGLIKVSFYKEIPEPFNFAHLGNTVTITNNSPWFCGSTPTLGGYNSSIFNAPINCFHSTITDSLQSSVVTTSASYSANASADNKVTRGSATKGLDLQGLETGLVTKGSISAQKFSDVNLDFQYSPFLIELVKILPESQQVYTTEDIKYRKYCSECGAKTKQGDKFCSNCGEKL
jgi:hypothetical protein